MDNSFASRFRKAWNVFFNKDPTPYRYTDGPGSSYPPGHLRRRQKEKSTLSRADFWCERRDLNPYVKTHAPQTCASADSATLAFRLEQLTV